MKLLKAIFMLLVILLLYIIIDAAKSGYTLLEKCVNANEESASGFKLLDRNRQTAENSDNKAEQRLKDQQKYYLHSGQVFL